ncbi:MAG: GxxExxY protein [Deltaproteobacteria bacterium]|nr:GxxExxY protein [Deltaproteobacteria bacterium]
MKTREGLEHEDLTDKIIGCAINVHKKLGPGFLESIYENAFVVELQKQNLKVDRQQEIIIKYDGIEVGRHRLDLFVDDTVVVELKAVKNIEDIHFAIVKSYLKALGKEHGLLINFSKKVLEVKRVICN